ncbi:unnamed protein product [Pieris brassicae]|uniref:Cyclic nucleotide-binding domain-containing protein n=1 Tax=Pieris brassicae TaxID=7116 RepID=A0A9P0T073_PIEBR|nr:unnamed protein product [Pieris brassicae]
MSCRFIVAYDQEDFIRRLESLPGPFMETVFHPDGNMVCNFGSWIDSAKIFKAKYLTPKKVYLLSYYWSAASFTGAGFGDITAQDTAHMLLSICINVHGVLFFGYVYARIASLKAMADQVVTKFQENLKHIDLFMAREKVPFVLKKSIIDYWKYQWKRTGGWSHQKILGKLHANLNEDAVLFMYEKTLREIPLFEDVEYSFFRAFAKKLKEGYFQKGYMIMRSNEVIKNMYIIYRGKVDIITDDNEVEACMGPGGIFGNIKGASKYLTMSNITASRNLDLLYIEGHEFFTLLKLETYPLSYEVEEEEENGIEPNIFLESPDKSIAESHGSRSIASGFSADYTSALTLIFLPHRYFSKVYLRRRDFLANLPISYLAFAVNLTPTMQNALFCYLRTPQLFRITYLFTYRQHRKINIGTANLLLKLTTIAIWASILSHINACLFFKLSCLTPVHCTSANWMSKPELNLRAKYAEKNYFPLYVASLWYIINLLTITGTGDVSSQNDFEVIETVFITIVIKFCTGLLISETSALITAHSSSRIAYDEGINELRDGLRDTELSNHQMNKMWDYVRELWSRQQGRQMPKLVTNLPFRLRCQIMQAVYGSHIRESVIFSKTDDDFKRMLCMWLRHCVFFPGNYIVQCGDADQCIYFIHRGEVEVLTVHPNLTESIYDILGPEDSFGVAQGLFVGVAHHFSFRARTVVDIVYLKLEEWKYLLDFYPKSAKLLRRKVENVYLAI